MKKKSIILLLIGLFAFFFVLALGCIAYYNVCLGSVNKKSTNNVEFTVSMGEATSTIIANLENKGLIKSALVLKIYAKLHPGVPQAGSYILTTKMTAKEIYDILIEGRATYDTVWVTFVEGKRLNYIASQIANNFDYTVEEVESVLDDKDYIKELIDKYDILTEDILNDKIYHPLEGYLFPDTYEFMADSSIKDIIEKMVATTDIKVSAYASEIEKSNLSIHEIMTLASMVELEGTNADNRSKIAGVFMNRLNAGWTSLGSDVTTYYSVGKDFGQDLTMSDLRSCNDYNTSGYGCHSGLPVGPISSVSTESIVAAINPAKHDYYFFVSDKNREIYFSKTNSEHDAIIADLRRKGLWYTYN